MGSEIQVVAALIVDDGHLLICQRRRDAAFPLKWEFPGGKVKGGESPEAALQRELEEELGVQATVGALVFEHTHRYAEPGLKVHLLFYNASLKNQAPRNLEFEDMQWVEPARLREFDFLAGDLPVVEELASGRIRATQTAIRKAM